MSAGGEGLHNILIFSLISPGIDVVVDGTWTVMKKQFFFSFLKKYHFFHLLQEK